MKKFVFILILIITCAGRMPAQVINYTIDPSFNSGLTLTRGGVSDIIHTSTNRYLVMGNYLQSYPQAGVFFEQNGQLNEDFSQVGGSYAAEYKDRYIQFGFGLRQFTEDYILYSDFKFEFQKQLYNGPLSNIALDVLILENDNILVAGRFFTDSTLMNTNIESQGLRQLCLIDSLGKPVPGFPMVHCTQPIDAHIVRLDSLSDGSYIISGQFTEVNGYAYNNIAKLNSDFTVDTTFQSPFNPAGIAGVNLIDDLDRIWLTAIEGSTFINQEDVSVSLARLLPNGSVDTTFQIPTILLDYEDYHANSYATVIKDTDDTFIIHGYITSYNGYDVNKIAKIQDNGDLIIGAFSDLGADAAIWGNYSALFGPTVSVVKKLPDGKLIIGGNFSSFGGEPYSCLVRLQPSGFVGVDEKAGRGKLEVYPNPARESIQIRLPDKNQRLTRVQIYDLNGRLVQEVNIVDASGTIDLINLPQGMYVVKAISEKQVLTGKVLVE
ncbi:T9SS type A sorting domain-containing protein [Cryomorpha ignava]|uniref:T9SS type A sorting domain-containing protein n=1 Tax=Cryomorpha ignava TaxID=101383 RepID=A0A7K3WYU3_9FLAO|nr:T9SS type A sorting domain-containing protein [Cryomorpha ignava]NEN25855.1 T9SS type A sorting domain-containing protein [Cryomorpha ignava]